MTNFDQIDMTHYILEQAMKFAWDAEMLGPCKNNEFMMLMKKIRDEIEEAHRLLGKVKE